jgi:hypothetical protein
MCLEHPALLKVVVGRDSRDTGRDLNDDVGDSGVHRDAAIPEGHNCDRRVEVATGDGAAQEGEDGQGRTDRPGIAGGDDDGQENERTEELDEDGGGVHRSGFYLGAGYFSDAR